MKAFRYLTLMMVLVCIPISLCATPPRAFKTGEKLEYDVYFNIGFLYFNVARATMRIDQIEYNKTPCYKFTISANTNKSYGENTLNDTLTAYMTIATLQPLYAVQATHENSYQAWNKYYFSYDQDGVHCTIERIRKRGTTTMKVNNAKPYYDVTSILYLLRNTMDPHVLQNNQKVNTQMVLDDGLYSLYWRYVGPERIKLKNKDLYDCVLIKPAFIDCKLFEKGEMMDVFLSNDQNKIPVMFQAKLKIGSIKAYLVKSHNLAHPLTSKVAKPKN